MTFEPELDFQLDVVAAPDRTVVSVGGELDVATAPELQAAITDALARDVPLVLDATGVTFMDSTGLAGLLAIRSDGAGDRELVLRPSPAVRRILELTGITGIFQIDDSAADGAGSTG